MAQACLETFDAVAARAQIQVGNTVGDSFCRRLHYAFFQAERVEVERLRGLVDLLRKRCDELESTVESSTRALRNERARAVDLERRAESAGGGKKVGGTGGKPSTPGTEKVKKGVEMLPDDCILCS
jgi:hypothetical protein